MLSPRRDKRATRNVLLSGLHQTTRSARSNVASISTNRISGQTRVRQRRPPCARVGSRTRTSCFLTLHSRHARTCGGTKPSQNEASSRGNLSTLPSQPRSGTRPGTATMRVGGILAKRANEGSTVNQHLARTLKNTARNEIEVCSR